MTSVAPRPARRLYLQRIAGCIVAYVVLLVPADWLAHHGRLPVAPWLYLVAAAPALPVLGMVRAMLAYLEGEEDEYQRMLQVKGFVLGCGFTLAICSVWGFLQNFAALPMIPLFQVFSVFVPCQALATSWVSWRANR